MKKFEVGKTYEYPGLYTPSFRVRVVARTDKTITFEEVNYPGDNSSPRSITYDEAGNEIIEVWHYSETVGCMRA